MSRHSKLISTAAKYGLHVSWQNTDGVRCYRFHRKSADYHSGGHIGHCNGIKQAEVFMWGFACANNTERDALLDAIAQVLTGPQK